MSYGDDEANIFNVSNPGSVEYGMRCDQVMLSVLVSIHVYGCIYLYIYTYVYPSVCLVCLQEFMLLGLRGLTLVFASGDDGVSGLLNECTTSQPSWPAR